MATIDEDLKAFLEADPAISAVVVDRICENHVPQAIDTPFIWFARTGDDDEYCLDDEPGSGPFRFQFSIECVDEDIGTSANLAALVKHRLNKVANKSSFGSTTVQGCWCENQSDDYISRAGGGDSGFHVSALSAEVVPS